MPAKRKSSQRLLRIHLASESLILLPNNSFQNHSETYSCRIKMENTACFPFSPRLASAAQIQSKSPCYQNLSRLEAGVGLAAEELAGARVADEFPRIDDRAAPGAD